MFHDHGNPIPDAERGCYAFNRYHSNDHGHGEGFWGSLRESYAAEDAFEARNRGILEVAGLGETGKGDWDNLGRSGLLLDVDPQYLLAFGFTQVILLQLIATREAHLSNSRLFACLVVFYNNPYTLLRTHARAHVRTQLGGEPFTLEHGLRPHLLEFAAQLERDHDEAFEGKVANNAESRQLLSQICEAYPSTTRPWDVTQQMDDPTSIIELYDKATSDARRLWDLMVATATVR